MPKDEKREKISDERSRRRRRRKYFVIFSLSFSLAYSLQAKSQELIIFFVNDMWRFDFKAEIVNPFNDGDDVEREWERKRER